MVGGYSSAGVSAELLYTNGTSLCNLPNLPVKRDYPSQTGLVTCGGKSDETMSSCLTFKDGTWQQTHTLGTRRQHHLSWASPQGVLLIGGDYAGGTTTELLNDNGSTTPSFDLDYNTE